MFLETMTANAPLFFLIFARVFAMLAVAPLFSSESIPDAVRILLAVFTSAAVFSWVSKAGYPVPDVGLSFFGLLVGEVLLGLLQGFFLTLVFQAFQMAGQFMAQQMGFGASEVYDPLAQIEMPVLGQVMNLLAMFVFVSIQGFQQVFLLNVYESFRALKAADMLSQTEFLSVKLLSSLGQLFERSFILSLPVFGTLLLVSVVIGLLGKAAPQMNLMMMGFPITIVLGFSLLLISMPFLVDAFAGLINNGFRELGFILDAMAPPLKGAR